MYHFNHNTALFFSLIQILIETSRRISGAARLRADSDAAFRQRRGGESRTDLRRRTAGAYYGLHQVPRPRLSLLDDQLLRSTNHTVQPAALRFSHAGRTRGFLIVAISGSYLVRKTIASRKGAVKRAINEQMQTTKS